MFFILDKILQSKEIYTEFSLQVGTHANGVGGIKGEQQ